LKIIIVERSRQYWAKVFPILDRFWKDYLLSKIVYSRMDRSQEIREPAYVTMTIAKKQSFLVVIKNEHQILKNQKTED